VLPLTDHGEEYAATVALGLRRGWVNEKLSRLGRWEGSAPMLAHGRSPTRGTPAPGTRSPSGSDIHVMLTNSLLWYC